MSSLENSPDIISAAAGALSGREKALTETDAIELWISRWLRVPPNQLVQRYQCDSRRLYEIWWGQKFPYSRTKAVRLFKQRYPGASDRTDFGYRRIPVGPQHDPRQQNLFD